MQEEFSIGTDPEVFLESEKGDIIPAVGLIGGSKNHPLLVHKGAVQEDNVLGEFNIHPAATPYEFKDNIRRVMHQLENRVNPLKLKVLSSHHFTKEVLKGAGRQAMQFGCDPDINAWTGEENSSPNPFTTLRTAGGHVHVGFKVDDDDQESRFNVIKLMDVYLGVPSVLLDNDVERRSLYGKAGACRLKEYGAEYRVLSNFWLQSDAHMDWVYNQTKRAVDNMEYLDEILAKYNPETIQYTINNSDKNLAEVIVADLNLEMV